MHLLGRPTTILTDITAFGKGWNEQKRTSAFINHHLLRCQAHNWALGGKRQQEQRVCGLAEERDTQKPKQCTVREVLGWAETMGLGAVSDWDPRARVTGDLVHHHHLSVPRLAERWLSPGLPVLPKAHTARRTSHRSPRHLYFQGTWVCQLPGCVCFLSLAQGLPRRGKINENSVD